MSSGTATTHGARDHARAQAGTLVDTMPTVPAPEGLTWSETVAGGGYTSKVLSRGTTLRLTDVAGDACAHLLLFHADRPWERLNVADTVKVLWQAYLTTGHLLLSDQGRVLASLGNDTSARHDSLTGTSSRRRNEDRYGDGAVHGPSPAGRELLLQAAAKHDLGPRDVGPSISFFKGVRFDEAGTASYEGSTGPGTLVELTAELPLVVLIANTAHPLDPRPEWACSPLRVEAWRGQATTSKDRLWSATPEGQRAFENTQDLLEAQA